MVFQYLESTLHTSVVATSDKPRTSFQVVRNNLCYYGTHKIREPVCCGLIWLCMAWIIMAGWPISDLCASVCVILFRKLGYTRISTNRYGNWMKEELRTRSKGARLKICRVHLKAGSAEMRDGRRRRKKKSNYDHVTGVRGCGGHVRWRDKDRVTRSPPSDISVRVGSGSTGTGGPEVGHPSIRS